MIKYRLTFEDLPLAKSLYILNDRVVEGDLRPDFDINRKSMRNDAPCEEWFYWLNQNASIIWREIYNPGLSSEFTWSPITTYCMAQRMCKNKKGGTSRCAMVALYKGDSSCRRCGKNTGQVQTDHIIPRKQGGLDHIDNYQLTCSSCNRGKSWNNCFQSHKDIKCGGLF